MLESQASSNSISSLKIEDSKRSSLFPEKFIAVAYKRIYFDNRLISDLIVTSEYELVECSNGEVVNYMNLKGYFPENNLQILREENVEIEFILDEDQTIYAIKINSTLFGILRKHSQLKLLKVIEKVKTIQNVVEDETGDILLEVTSNDNKKHLTTFLDEDFLKNKSSQRFNGIFERVAQAKVAAETHLSNLTREVEEMSLKLRGEIPAMMLQDVSRQVINSSLKITPPSFRIPTINHHSSATAASGHAASTTSSSSVFPSSASVKSESIILCKNISVLLCHIFNKFSNWTIFLKSMEKNSLQDLT